MARSNKKSGSSDYMKLPYMPGDTIPAPEALEIESEEALRVWNQLHAEEQARFAQTQPMDALPTQSGDPRYAKTQPSPLKATAPEPAQAPPRAPVRITLDDVMLEARRYNRVCPQPEQWKSFCEALSAAAPEARRKLPAPLSGGVWKSTPSLAKRMVFREQLEWAEREGCLDLAAAQLKSLPEESWYHMGD